MLVDGTTTSTTNNTVEGAVVTGPVIQRGQLDGASGRRTERAGGYFSRVTDSIPSS